MSAPSSRRAFLRQAAASGLFLSAGELEFLNRLRPVSAAEAKLDSNLVRLEPDIEPLVQLLEDTPRDRLLEEIAARIRKGLTYREVLAALQLAAVRNVQPRPNVGFKFHAVLVVNSAHLASLSSPDSDRWLPIFWALDYFKSSQAATQKESGWRMGPVKESEVPSARKARGAFTDAMDNWDEAAADTAVAGLARSAGADQVFEIFCRYGARDFRAIGHKAIFVANSWRTLQCIGWQHAEPILRSLAYALQNHEGDNPAKRDAPADRPWRRNQELAARISSSWQEGQPRDEATREMLNVLRQGSDSDACDKVVELLNRGTAAQSIWDAYFCAGAEMVMRQPGIVALHTLTTTNAMHFAYVHSADDMTRRLLLLQNAAFLPMFRGEMNNRGKVQETKIDEIEPAPLKSAGSQAVSEIFADVSRDRMTAARKVLTYLRNQSPPKDLIDAARVLVFLKGNDSHDYKFSSAVLEDYTQISPAWRDRFLAASMFQLRGSQAANNGLVNRIRGALNA